MTLTETKWSALQRPAAGAAGGLLLDPPEVTRILTLKQQHGWAPSASRPSWASRGGR